MPILLTYTLTSYSSPKEPELKTLLIKAYGYADNLYDGERVEYKLPYFSLWRQGTDIYEAGKQFVDACKSVGAEYKSYIAVNYDRCSFDNQ